MDAVPGHESAPQRFEQAAVAGTYAANTNSLTFTRPVRRLRLYLAADTANKFLYMVAAKAAVAVPATPLAAAGSRYRFNAATLANGGTVVDIAFDFEVYFLYFLTSTGTCDVHAIGWEK